VDSAIRTLGLTKFYGPVRGIEEIDLEVRQGEVFGFLGPNGAGKTTTIRLLLDLLRPTRGRAEIFGLDTRRDSLQVRSRVGYISGDVSLFESMKGRALVELLDSFHGGGAKVDDLAERLDLDLDRPIRAYSRGMKQKLAIIQALSHDPDLLVLDEPTTGLDPLVQQEFYNLVAEVRDAGKTVFLSSHILPEVERVCDRIGIVKEGRLVAVEQVSDLKRKKVRHLEIFLTRDVQQEDLALDGVEVLAMDGPRARLAVHGNIGTLIAGLASLPVDDLVFPEATLEETFMRFYSSEADDEPVAVR
jgi:ABC-2 type transport system ATP-binding protein